ncbi:MULTISPECIES: fructose-1,6-bisphosphatase [Aerococcus]|uniref:fructose-1,6-bisphosphatase n=1 Tax=Aerococcus TaxID=1375 RepID=UPI00227D42B9|nr:MULTISPECIES: fructose-1,6-bisphosphatase [Aerococcus]MCY3036300.1 fructose-1,6-bisphosphatase [Aerococcus sp. Group 2]MCY3039666.1 fructose-1,6-bisphosphatase [Aerococcus sp. Group 2]MCY3041873.1 fructose-1,6-bisphosphatase [Aerococcus sp. Group 2]MCY3043122.1 fructose-1,6-bisphosphatase [Aerococcus sp. Group 2]MDK6520314.1 fructose-1,6-bisphosphatase [Aerococcus urinae]
MAFSPAFLQLLAEKFPNKAAASTEMINLEAIMSLPKGTEHFMTDLHGEFDAVNHVLRNGSGNIKEKINEIFGDRLSTKRRAELATIIYYPEEKLRALTKEMESQEEIDEFYTLTTSRLVELTQFVVSKYTRSKVHKAMNPDMAYIMDELIFKDSILSNKEHYYKRIIQSVIDLDEAPRLITCLAELIRELVVDHLHILGDIYDRGPAPDRILDLLMEKNSLDIEWGNHDMIWMGAASGSKALIANVVRIQARYDNLSVIEHAYGIPLRPLVNLADTVYRDADLTGFMPKLAEDHDYHHDEVEQLARMQLAMAIIQFKLEAQVIRRHPEFGCDNRLLLDKIDYQAGTIDWQGKTYPLVNTSFPTVDPKDPYALTEDEEAVMEALQAAFLDSERLQKHVAFLINKGSMYKIYNNNLMFHGCIPMNEDGTFMAATIDGETLAGQDLLDKFDQVVRRMYAKRQSDESKNPDLDFAWYLWQGEGSALFGKKQMATFERYFIADKETHQEHRNVYYSWREDINFVRRVLEEFGIDPDKGHIINGHTPIKAKDGEDAIKAEGKMIVIDGGFARAYQKTTGLGGFTLLYNSYGMQLVAHHPFHGKEDAIKYETDIESTRRVVDKELERISVRETDIGKQLTCQVQALKALIEAYQAGLIGEEVH